MINLGSKIIYPEDNWIDFTFVNILDNRYHYFAVTISNNTRFIDYSYYNIAFELITKRGVTINIIKEQVLYSSNLIQTVELAIRNYNGNKVDVKPLIIRRSVFLENSKLPETRVKIEYLDEIVAR